MLFRKILFFIILFSSSISLAQQVSLGVKLESFGYSYKNTMQNTTELSVMPLPLSGYLKASVLFYNRYEAEVKYGIQIDELLAGQEYSIAVKYRLLKKLYPLLTYMKHFNSGESRTGNGIYNSRIEFIGFGLEVKLTKLFGIDLVYYKQAGEKDLEYSLIFNNALNKMETITTAKIDSMLKLGFIFNINL